MLSCRAFLVTDPTLEAREARRVEVRLTSMVCRISIFTHLAHFGLTVFALHDSVRSLSPVKDTETRGSWTCKQVLVPVKLSPSELVEALEVIGIQVFFDLLSLDWLSAERAPYSFQGVLILECLFDKLLEAVGAHRLVAGPDLDQVTWRHLFEANGTLVRPRTLAASRCQADRF